VSLLLWLSEKGSQYASDDYWDFLSAFNLTSNMSRRDHCLDNVVAESAFHALKTQRVKRKGYAKRRAARAIVFYYTEMFYPRTGLHSHGGGVYPDEYETIYSKAS
jgi:putative transposase